MRNLSFVVPNDQCFNLSDELFQIEPTDLEKIVDMGPVFYRFMSAMQSIVNIVSNSTLKLSRTWQLVRSYLLIEINPQHKKLIGVHPQRNSLLTRVDFMVDQNGELKIAEIDPINKHGIGFALLCRNESGHEERQKILSLLSELFDGYKSLAIIISERDNFFRLEQEYFAKKLGEYSGKPIHILEERMEERIPQITKRIEDPDCCFLDCPVLGDKDLNQRLLDVFANTPKRFLVPPKHWMGNKAIMAFLYEPELLMILRAFLNDEDIRMLQKYIPLTLTTNPKSKGFVVKKVLSSGAKGVFFGETRPTRNVIYQEYVSQKKFLLENKEQYIRLAAHFVGVKLAELTVTSSSQVPVHGNSESVNYHVILKS